MANPGISGHVLHFQNYPCITRGTFRADAGIWLIIQQRMDIASLIFQKLIFHPNNHSFMKFHHKALQVTQQSMFVPSLMNLGTTAAE